MNEVTAPEGNGRKYRSKKQRPCDLCRTRKIHCKLQANGAGCELCRRLGRQCTFVLGPLRRKYRARNGPEDAPEAAASQQRRSSHDQSERLDVTGMPPMEGLEVNRLEETSAGLGDGDHWSLPTDMRQQFAIQDMHSMMDYYGLDSNGVAADLPAISSAQDGPGNGSNFMLDRHHENSNLELDSGFLRDILSPSRLHNERPASRSTAQTSTNNGSPSDASGHSSQFSPSLADPKRGSDRRLGETRYVGLESSPQTTTWPPEFSLEDRKGYSNHLIGLSCESDPFLLRHYKYNSYDNYRMFRLDFRKISNEAQSWPNLDMTGNQGHAPKANVPLQFMMSDETIWQDDLKASERCLSGDGTEDSDRALLSKIVNPELGRNLVSLYTRFVHPRFPVLSSADLGRLKGRSAGSLASIGIQSAVYALAAPFTFLDDELSVSNGYLGVPTDDLWDIAQRSFQRASCFSHISLLQLCLLLLNKPPQNMVVAEPTKFWALSCSAVAIAENLGANVDPVDWRLPKDEIMLRRRLWWLTFVSHTWHALVSGRPSHIHEPNWCVSRLTEEDFEKSRKDPLDVEAEKQLIDICLAHVSLGVIAADVLREFYSVRANLETLALPSLLSRAQRLRTRIESWRQTLPFLSRPVLELDEQDFEKGAVLRLQHLTLEILIFRALLRPLDNDQVSQAEKCDEPISTIYENCHVCANVATEIVSLLRAKHFASFWPHYTRYQLCYVSTLILLILAQSATTEIALRNKALLDKWRDTLRIQARAWPLARLAAMRLDASFWKGISSVIHGAGSDSPALRLLKESTAAKEGDEIRS
ncbi:fungal specific transcription factor domain-containing protein [Sarocladium implicatum]|nr:fungal specific transcription factor domain-containing protein [Sarocladium implicatum]